MIPLTVEDPIGVLVISWVEQFPLIFFHRALKLIDLLKQLLS